MTAPAPRNQPIDIELGLPGPLPEGERVLWHGKPARSALSRYLFRWPMLATYLALVALLPLLATVQQGAGLMQIALSPLLVLPFAAVILAFVQLGSWLLATTSTYIITDRRVILQVGVALTRTVNIPLRQIAHVGERDRRGSRDIALTLRRPNKIAWLALWPHALATQWKQPVPLLRALPADSPAGQILVDALMRAAPGIRHPSQSPVKDKARAQTPVGAEARV
ncbi:photosynthetic complex putative assembly protein PuhB [Aurantiacibacter zhengii]|uniref:PH domain-containing protein n=1 Tax=Aurantiacibacter zhengii TaxID=2307003 RepID=A0A418NXB1_9SPHN|nr:photosynthetic complex putative assembly protein PuhB [Aurantiacibacter zhengii]RIV89249.1 PH domain-containing protein [Aurantiacibacter zhengii]